MWTLNTNKEQIHNVNFSAIICVETCPEFWVTRMIGNSLKWYEEKATNNGLITVDMW